MRISEACGGFVGCGLPNEVAAQACNQLLGLSQHDDRVFVESLDHSVGEAGGTVQNGALAHIEPGEI
jgi:hypothetical protein